MKGTLLWNHKHENSSRPIDGYAMGILGDWRLAAGVDDVPDAVLNLADDLRELAEKARGLGYEITVGRTILSYESVTYRKLPVEVRK